MQRQITRLIVSRVYMIYPMVPFPVTLTSKSRGYHSLDALDVLRAQLTRDLFAIAKFLCIVVDTNLRLVMTVTSPYTVNTSH